MGSHLSSDQPSGGVPVAPPPVVHESVPPPRAGHSWMPGYWDWTNGRHVWVAGHWVPMRQGCHWRRHRWILRGGRWYLEPGRWILDERVPSAPERPAYAQAR